MTHNLLEGALPAAWGQTGSFPKLQILSINNNMFTGDLPYTWGSASSFPAMRNPSSGVCVPSPRSPALWTQKEEAIPLGFQH